MARITRERVIASAPAVVWRTVSDPATLPRWWPGVERVEGARGSAFSQVMRSSRGRPVRADFQWVRREQDARLRWRQSLAGTPFDEVFAARAVAIELAAAADGATRVSITVEQTLRGAARYVTALNRRGVRRQLDAALEGLDALLTGANRGSGAGVSP